MATQLSKHGVSTTTMRGQFRSEPYVSAFGGGVRVQWDYRDSHGKLFSGIARSEDEAKQKAQQASGETI